MNEVRADGWLGEVMEVPAFRVEVGAGENLDDLAGRLRNHLREHPRAFYYAKVDCERADVVRRLGGVGFSVVDTNVTFELARAPEISAGGTVAVAPAQDGDLEAIVDIAGAAFRRDRFHLDPLVPDQVADRIKREWCRSYARKARGDRLFAARVDGRPAGFLAALTTPDTAVIDLIGVAPEFQRRRVGVALTEAFVQHYRNQVGSLQVGTQVANIASVRLYERLGFSALRSHYVLHLHVQDGEPRR